ncbi:MAG TPA: hypothetical protein VFR90_15920 [Methylibium sp.]|uniref:hypothetical protein n=1 Tax=Methylibium sp. TaxID=2067992 RepID=UPI002DBDDAC2|nr:hypothetical protein [Methylibium sp.]HEU4460608.1 hypothetical protein [Methylibium sp.]
MVLMWLQACGNAVGLWQARRAAAGPVVRLPGFTARIGARGAGPARLRRRAFWMRVDPKDPRRAAIGGSFAEVCAALEALAAEERAAC